MDDKAHLFIGANGHDYVVSLNRAAVVSVAGQIGRSPAGVYQRRDLGVWAMRIRLDADKAAVRRLFGRD